MQVIPLCSIHSFIKGFNVQNRPWKVMATLKVLQVNLCRLRERKSHVRESSKKKSRERASKGMQHESAAQACTHIRSVPAESGAKVIKVCSRESTLVVAKAWRIVCEGHISRLVKSFKSTMAHLPGQSGRSYISRSSEAATQNQRVKALPRGCGSSFSCPKQTLEGHGYPKSSSS